MAGAKVANPILPQPGKRNILITSALPYVNNVPHLGNIIGAPLSADVASRYFKARGFPTLFICGTDEYGTATETKALEEGVSPKELCDKYHAVHKAVYDWIGIEFDNFGRSSNPEQTVIVQDAFLKLHKNGYIEERTDEQPYCADPKHQRFLADRFVEGECPICHGKNGRGDQCDDCGNLLNPKELINPRCKVDGTTPELRQTKHFYLRLNELQPEIEKWLNTVRGTFTTNAAAIADDWLKKGLLPRGITRDLVWGVPVPYEGFENKVFYVWFDACYGYVSITADYTDEWRQWWHNPDVELFQFMGKDNVPFHGIIFPGSQLGSGDNWTMVKRMSTTEYLNYEKGKFSKSRGIGVFGTNAQDTGVPPDVWRYYLLKRRPETSDSEFEWLTFIQALNGELVANFGNFVNRLLKFACNAKFYNGIVPEFDATKYDGDRLTSKVAEIDALLTKYHEQMDNLSLRAGLQTAMEISGAGNEWLQANTLDGNLFNNNRATCDIVVGLALNLVHLLAAVFRPYLPASSKSILAQLGLDSSIEIPTSFELSAVKPGHQLGTPELLFKPILKEQEQADAWKEQFGGSEAKKLKEAQEAKKKAEKERKKQKKAAAAVQAANAQGSTFGDAASTPDTVESADKHEAAKLDGGKPGKLQNAGDGEVEVEAVTQGVHQAALHSS